MLSGSSTADWSRRLEAVLADRIALDAFYQWLMANSTPEPLNFHFAICSFEQMAREQNEKTGELAATMHAKFTSTRTGCCSFIPKQLRTQISAKVKSIGAYPDVNLFQPVKPFLDGFLRKQHEQFVCSDEFISTFNRVMDFSSASDSFTMDKRRMKTSKLPTLTAEALKQTRRERENTLGESSVEKMFPGSIRHPYVCHATTSQNDSAVSSSFSSEANGNRHPSHRLRSIREEHIRGNPVTFALPRVEHRDRTVGGEFDHTTDEGRRHFAFILIRKLTRLQSKYHRNDRIQQRLKDLQEKKCTISDVITIDDADISSDSDEELAGYVERMKTDSIKASADRTPYKQPSPRCESPERARFAHPVYGRTASFAPPPNYFKDRSSSRSAYDSSGIGSIAPSSYSDGANAKTARRIQTTMHTGTTRRPKSSSSPHLITISYKGDDGVPVVAHVPLMGGQMTLKEFRRHFSISSNAHVQFFFKTFCDDGSAPYQLLLITEDCAEVPIFDGRITAELKQINRL